MTQYFFMYDFLLVILYYSIKRDLVIILIKGEVWSRKLFNTCLNIEKIKALKIKAPKQPPYHVLQNRLDIYVVAASAYC